MLIPACSKRMSVSTNEVVDMAGLIGSQFGEPMRVIENPTLRDFFAIVSLVGTRSKDVRGGFMKTRTRGTGR